MSNQNDSIIPVIFHGDRARAMNGIDACIANLVADAALLRERATGPQGEAFGKVAEHIEQGARLLGEMIAAVAGDKALADLAREWVATMEGPIGNGAARRFPGDVLGDLKCAVVAVRG